MKIILLIFILVDIGLCTNLLLLPRNDKSLNCENVTGRVNITWIHNNNMLVNQTDSTLILNNVDTNSSGVYICRVNGSDLCTYHISIFYHLRYASYVFYYCFIVIVFMMTSVSILWIIGNIMWFFCSTRAAFFRGQIRNKIFTIIHPPPTRGPLL
ncbi:putative immunoglobulin-like domain containing protein [Namao virus]|nr:putative immunoglobulin-like domain containing protein [Namao virus]